MIEGEIVVDESARGVRLDNFCLAHIPGKSRAFIKTQIEAGGITLDGKTVKAGYALKPGHIVRYAFEDVKPIDATPQQIDFEIVFENQNLLVINKPQGLVVHPCQSSKSGTLVNGLLARVHDLSGINGVLRPGIVHRLDKNTSGLMLVAKNDMAHLSLAKQIEKKTCVRKYLALLHGNLKDEQGQIVTLIGRNRKDRKKMAVVEQGGKEAITLYRVVKRFDKFCLVEFTLKTGRTHQIRVHAAHIGHPVVGDDVYGKAEKRLNGQLLHSYYIEFDEPQSMERLHFEVDLPDYFEDFLKKLK